MKIEQAGYVILAVVAFVAIAGLFFTYKGVGKATQPPMPEGDCFVKDGVVYCNCGDGTGLTAFEPRENVPVSDTPKKLCEMVCSKYGLEARCKE